jgi:DNA-damage-inducible protein D
MDGNLDYVTSALEAMKKVAPNGQPLWFARELMEILAYNEWRNFREVIEKAKEASNNAGIFSNDHFVDFTEEIVAGKGAKGKRDNCLLSRHAAYLIAMNGDPGKPEVATAQNYFAIQTQRHEAEQQLSEEQRRVLLRNRVKDGNKALGAAAYAAGVTGLKFGIFHDAGYKGLYDGIGRDAIKKLKGIPADEDLLDCMDRVELAANDFRITQTEQKLRSENIQGEQKAIDTHYDVGKKVRQAIENIGGAMPEKLPAVPSIRKVISDQEKQGKKLVKAVTAKKPAENSGTDEN